MFNKYLIYMYDFSYCLWFVQSIYDTCTNYKLLANSCIQCVCICNTHKFIQIPRLETPEMARVLTHSHYCWCKAKTNHRYESEITVPVTTAIKALICARTNMRVWTLYVHFSRTKCRIQSIILNDIYRISVFMTDNNNKLFSIHDQKYN